MSPLRALAVVATVVAALVLQVAFLTRLPLPGGTPNVLFATVVLLALRGGPGVGLGAGVVAGLLADALSGHPLGLIALLFGLSGFTVGSLFAEPRPRWWRSVLVVAGATVAVSLAVGAAAGFLGQSSLSTTVTADLLGAAGWAAMCAVVLARPVFAVARLARPLERETRFGRL